MEIKKDWGNPSRFYFSTMYTFIPFSWSEQSGQIGSSLSDLNSIPHPFGQTHSFAAIQSRSLGGCEY
ncbi:hypothetical protein DL897_07715 [Thermoflavimicrobium daqui]|uniref:Uncharacterized protein n=1 Tax=Thermoflavimicrobium daqui TaxID=2137476 RepID=A0A364K6P1_9BACL|nr:hypothetical protein DL897_07715 [Thermoflavimicrobium daqui]